MEYPDPDPAEAVMRAAARHRCYLSPDAAADIARAVLLCADAEYTVRHAISEDLRLTSAETAALMDSLERRMHHQLAAGLIEAGVLPVTLPRKITHAPRGPWSRGVTVVEWAVTVRRPLQIPSGKAVLSGGWYDGYQVDVPDGQYLWVMPDPPPLATGALLDMDTLGLGLGFAEVTRHLVYQYRGVDSGEGRVFHYDSRAW